MKLPVADVNDPTPMVNWPVERGIAEVIMPGVDSARTGHTSLDKFELELGGK
jgi:hypothetical protein